MTPTTPDEFKNLMIAGGIIENKVVSAPVDSMFTAFPNPFTIKDCKLVSLLFNDCTINTITIAGKTHIDSVNLGGGNSSLNSFSTDASPVVTSLSIGGVGNAASLNIQCKVHDLTLEECSITEINVNAGRRLNALSLKRGVFFNHMKLSGIFGTVQASFSEGAEMAFENAEVGQIGLILTPINAYRFVNTTGTSLTFDSLSFKKIQSINFQNSSFEKIKVAGDQNRLFEHLTLTFTGNQV